MIAIRNRRARAAAAFALFVGTISASGCAKIEENGGYRSALDRNADYSIFVARFDRVSDAGSPPECDGNGEASSDDTLNICWRGYYDLTLSPLEVIAGNPDISTETYRVVRHSIIRPERATLLAHAKRSATGEWRLLDFDVISVSGCLEHVDWETVASVNRTDTEWSTNQNTENKAVCFDRFLPRDRY